MMFAQEGITRNISSDNNSIMFSGVEEESSGGLARFRSAPSSFFASFLDGLKVNGTTSDSSVGEDEADKMFSGFIGCTNGDLSNIGICDLNELQQESCDLKQERTTEYVQQQDNRIWNGGNCSSNLLRQSSSPAGLFAGFDAMRQVGSFRPDSGTLDESISTSSGLSNHMNFTSPPSATSRFMPSIAENVNEHIGGGSPKDGQLRNGANANGRSYVPSFGSSSWNDAASPSSLKRNCDGDMKTFSSFNGLENQNGCQRNTTPGLIHHLSMPKTSSEMAAVENYLEFQQDDGVPCKIRAKRGFATHPRSIAERVRRNRISERMKKLQELFPDMDKQTNTAEMLDLAVDYIKDLQKQVQTLTDLKSKCTCPSKKSPAS